MAGIAYHSFCHVLTGDNHELVFQVQHQAGQSRTWGRRESGCDTYCMNVENVFLIIYIALTSSLDSIIPIFRQTDLGVGVEAGWRSPRRHGAGGEECAYWTPQINHCPFLPFSLSFFLSLSLLSSLCEHTLLVRDPKSSRLSLSLSPLTRDAAGRPAGRP